MKYNILLLAIFFSAFINQIYSQDTIVTVDKKVVIPCHITKFDGEYVFFTTNKLTNQMPVTDIEYCSNTNVEKVIKEQEPTRKVKDLSNKLEEYKLALAIKKQREEDSIKRASMPVREIKISDELTYIRNNLNNCHKEYRTGLIFIGVGIGVGTIGALTHTSVISIIGGVSGLVGTIIMIDSHKWIGRIGIGVAGNGVNVKYVF